MSLPTIRVVGSLSKLTGSANVVLGNGSASAPAYAFASSSNAGMYLVSGNTVGISGNGAQIASFAPGNTTVSGNIVPAVGNTFALGSSAVPWKDSYMGNSVYIGNVGVAVTTPAANVFAIRTSGTEKMRIDASGQVGIGNANPQNALVVNGTVESTASGFQLGYTGGSLRITGTTNYWTDGGIYFNRTPNGTDTTTWSIGRGYAQSDINIMVFMAPAGIGAKWMWTTLGTGSTIVHIDGDNLRLGIGKTPGTQLDLSTDSARKLTTTTWATGSDERIKEDIELANLDVCYETVKSIPLKRFSWKDSYAPADIQNDRRQLGFIAQDVETIMPKAVMQSAENGFDDFRTLNTDQLVKAMWGAVQKLMVENEALKSRLAAGGL